MSDRVDIVVVGAGIVGLATAHRLRERLPVASLGGELADLVVERR